MVRFEYRKQGDLRFLSHLDVMGTMERALRRSGVPVAYTKGFNPRLKLASDPALPLGHESEGEGLVVTFDSPVDPAEVIARVNPCLPRGLELIRWVAADAHDGAAGGSASGSADPTGRSAGTAHRVRYELRTEGLVPTAEQVLRFLGRDGFVVELPRKGMVDLRAHVESIHVRDRVIRMTLNSVGGRTVRPEQVLAALLERDPGAVPGDDDAPIRVIKLAASAVDEIATASPPPASADGGRVGPPAP